MGIREKRWNIRVPKLQKEDLHFMEGQLKENGKERNLDWKYLF